MSKPNANVGSPDHFDPKLYKDDPWEALEIPVSNGSLHAAFLPPSPGLESQRAPSLPLFHTDPAQTPIVVLHGNGMNAWCHRRLVEPFFGRNPIYLVDLRGHGKSKAKVDLSNVKGWPEFHNDALKIHDFLGQRHKNAPHGIGHSLGALLLLGLVNKGRTFSSLTLIEPVLLNGILNLAVRLSQKIPILARYNSRQRNALKRRSSWPDLAAVRASYLGKSFFTRFDPQVFEDYLAHGIRQDGDQVSLSCTPELESAIFRELDSYVLGASKLDHENVRFFVGDQASSTVTKAGKNAVKKRFPDAEIHTVKGQGHFIPFNVPDQISF